MACWSRRLKNGAAHAERLASALEKALMEIELRRTTENDLPYVLSAEGDDDSRRFIAVWPGAKHRAALDDTTIEHLIIESKPNSQPIGFVILAGLQGEHRSIEFM